MKNKLAKILIKNKIPKIFPKIGTIIPINNNRYKIKDIPKTLIFNKRVNLQ